MTTKPRSVEERVTRVCETCGYTKTFISAAVASHHFPRHSCTKKLALDARNARGVARLAAVDRTPKVCTHPVANHQHGTYACYVLDACRCGPCVAVRSEHESIRTRAKAYGRYNYYVDATPARKHIRSLMDQGMGLKRIVAVSDASQGQLWKLLYGKKKPDGTRSPSKRIRKEIADRLLAITLDRADGASVDAVGTTRRIQALVALGYSQSKIASRVGIDPSNFTQLTHARRTNVVVSTARKIAELYDELSMILPPNEEWRDRISVSRAKGQARRMGWLPPLAWDDEQLDDPHYRPTHDRTEVVASDREIDESAILRRIDGDRSIRLSKAETIEVVARWVAAGRPLNECEYITGINPYRYRNLERESA